MDEAPYRLGFVTGGLFAHQARIAAELYLDTDNWETVKDRVREDNLFQTRTPSTGTRYLLEVVRRLKALNQKQLQVVAKDNHKDRCQVMWVAACRHYQLLGDFAHDVVRDRYLHGDSHLAPKDFTRFVHQQSLWHPELEEKTERTISNLRQNAFLMLRQASMLEPDGLVVGAFFSAPVLDCLQPNDFLFFPTDDSAWKGHHDN